MSKRYGVTHISPDWDAITAAYLAQLIWGEMEWRFVPQNNPPEDVLDSAFVVVDVGRELNPFTRRFDHHQMVWENQKDTSATSLVWKAGHASHPSEFDLLWELVSFVTDGDTGKRTPEMQHSALIGMHADLSQFKRATNPTDTEVLHWGFAYLERKHEQLRFADRTKKEVEAHIWYRYEPYIVLLGNSTGALTRAANEQYPIVIFVNESEETNTIGIQRQTGFDMNMGDIVRYILAHHGDEPGFREELEGDGTEENKGWYCHSSGFFAGRGTKGAPTKRPITIDMNSLVEFVGQAFIALRKDK